MNWMDFGIGYVAGAASVVLASLGYVAYDFLKNFRM